MDEFHGVPADLPQIPGGRLMGGGPVTIALPGVLLCMHCDEPIDEHLYVLYPATPVGMHPECAMRSVVGSVGHQTCRCSCYGGDYDDPPGLTRRQAAVAAWRLWEARTNGRN